MIFSIQDWNARWHGSAQFPCPNQVETLATMTDPESWAVAIACTNVCFALDLFPYLS